MFFFKLYEPYADNPSTRGFMRLEPETLFDVIPKFLRDGWQVVSSLLFLFVGGTSQSLPRTYMRLVIGQMALFWTHLKHLCRE